VLIWFTTSLFEFIDQYQLYLNIRKTSNTPKKSETLQSVASSELRIVKYEF
jgi:hypothetical protein